MRKFTLSMLVLLVSVFFMAQSAFSQNILAVDRDGTWADHTDCWPFFQAALDAGGYSYTYYEVLNGDDDGPDLVTMMDYDIIIWFTGEVWQNSETMTDNDEANLADYLDAGGTLFLSGQDYLWDRFPAAGAFSSGDFPYDYLGLRSVTQDNWVVESPDLAGASGVAGSLAEGHTFEVEDIFTTKKEGLFIDQIDDHVGMELFEITSPSPSGYCALQYEARGIKTVFTSLSFAGITEATVQADLMEAIIDFLYESGGAGPFCDDFDSYTAGDFLCTQSDLWTTWDDNPGGDYDAYVTDEMASSLDNSVSIDASVIESDIVTDLGQTMTGVWEVSLDIYVPDDGTYGGYYNVMQDMELFGAANEWGFQVYFKSDGTGYFYDADFNETEFTYNLAEWNHSVVYVDLDNAMARYFLNGEMVGEPWQWDIDGPNMLGAVDIFAAADGSDDPKFYIDNFCFLEVEPADFCDDFDSYTADDFLCTQSDLWTTWDDNPGGDYDAYVRDNEAQTPPNSIGIDADIIESDIVTDLGQTMFGTWAVALEILVPADGVSGGYWNIMQDMELFGSGNEWGFQIYYKSDGTGYMYDADFNETEFVYTPGEWTNTIVVINLDESIAELWINNSVINVWQWDIDGPNMLGAVDIFAAADGSDEPRFYIDNFCFLPYDPVQDCDNFDDYTAGDFLCTQSPLWTTWDDNPGGDYDAYVTDVISNSPDNSIDIDASVLESDLIYNLYQTMAGSWKISLDIYVPDTGTCGGYYNVMQDMELFGAGNEWGFQVYFKSDGTGYFYDADFNQTDFDYNIGQWNNSVLYVNLDDSVAQYELNGSLLNTWQWNIDGPNMLGVIDIFAAADGSDDPKFFIDNVCFETFLGVGIDDPVIDYNTDIETNIYPNPARDRVKIEASSNIDEVRIFNNMGQLVFSSKFNSELIEVNTSNFTRGMYVVQVRSGEALEVRKLIIE